MADSVDRVFAHALNTVKRIPPLGSARPPPSDRYRLYGLYKQSMEGDVDRVMARPTGRGEDQAKWDAWNSQKGLSRTEAKRQYISTLIDTMHRYASQTPDARELVSELEFVWSQIKSNPPSDSSSHSPSNSNSNPYNYQASGESPQSSSDPPIYPLMSDRGSRHPRRDQEKARASDGGRLRVMSPISQSQQAEGGELEDEIEVEDFVDAPDSQIGINDAEGQSQHSSNRDPGGGQSPDSARRTSQVPKPATRISAAGALIGPIAKYFTQQKQETQKMEDAASKWQRRIESALIKMNAEIAALREQLEWQSEQNRSGSMYESLVHPFGGRRRKKGVLRLILDPFIGLVTVLAKHAVIDLAILAVVVVVMHYKGIPVERLEEVINGWIRKIQQLRIIQRFRRMQNTQAGQAASKYGMAAYKSVGNMTAVRNKR